MTKISSPCTAICTFMRPTTPSSRAIFLTCSRISSWMCCGSEYWRQRTGGVAGVNASLLDMLHDRADHHDLAVAYRVDVDFDGAVEEVVEQHRAVVGNLHRLAHVALEFFFLVDDFHRPPAQHVGRAYHQRISDGLGRGQGLVSAARGGVGRLAQVQALDHLLEALAVFGTVDGVRTGADDRHAGLFEGAAELQRGLAAVLDDHALGLLDADDLSDVLEGHRLEVQAVGGASSRWRRFPGCS